MIVDPAQLSASEVYFTMIQTLVPRPIAWILSENESGSHNIAPFSYFTAVSSSPPLIMVSIGVRPDGTPKDTCLNIRERKNFVVHIATASQMSILNESSASLPHGVSEADELDIKRVPLGDFPLPRIDGAPVAYGCELYEIKEIGDAPQSLVFGELKSIYIDETLCGKDEKGRVKQWIH